MKPERPRLAFCYFLLALQCAVICLPGLSSSPLWDPDEPRYADASRHMVRTGDWLVPYFNGKPRFEKPVLFNWFQAVWVMILGEKEIAYRLPSVLCAFATACFLMLTGRLIGSAGLGLVWGSLFISTFRPVTYARQGLVDATMVMFATAVVCLYASAVTGALDRRRAFHWACVAAALAFFAKGPVGVLIPLLAILLHRIWKRSFRGLRGLPLLQGALLFSIVAFPWFIYMLYRFGYAYLEFSLLKENVERMAGGAGYVSPEIRPFWYYFEIIPGDLAPWTVIVVAAVVWAAVCWRRFDESLKEMLRIGFCWAGAVLFLFSLSGYKLPHYILPVYPAMTMLGAIFLIHASRQRGTKTSNVFWLVAWCATALVLTISGVAFGHAFFGPDGDGVSRLIFPWILLAAGGVITLALLRKPAFSLGAGIATVSLAFGLLGGVNVPVQLDPYRPIKALVTSLKSHETEGAAIVGYKLPAASIVYYMDRVITFTGEPKELRAILKKEKEVFVFTRLSVFERLPPALRARLSVVEKRPEFYIRLTRMAPPSPEKLEYILVARKVEP
ncbi:ArnT family glycosyltransferase [Acidobacteriota bacterium]